MTLFPTVGEMIRIHATGTLRSSETLYIKITTKETTMLPRFTLQYAHNKYFIVVSEDGPSFHPHRHQTREEAVTEAQRLAALHPGKDFTVFESVVAHSATVSTILTKNFA